MVYPTLLAAVGDVAHPTWRASAVGVYRLWRDGGYAIGALMAGGFADVFGMRRAIGAVGALTIRSGPMVETVMYETCRDPVASASGSGVLARAWKHVAPVVNHYRSLLVNDRLPPSFSLKYAREVDRLRQAQSLVQKWKRSWSVGWTSREAIVAEPCTGVLRY